MEQSISVGADLEAVCSQCGLATHVVVAKVGDDIAKIQCKRCGRSRRPRLAEREATGGKRSGPPRARASRPRPQRPMRAVAAPTSVEFDPTRPPRGYTPGERYLIGERIEHASFGVGLVESSGGPGKITVRFDDAVRVLAQAKPDSTLVRSMAPVDAPVEEQEERSTR